LHYCREFIVSLPPPSLSIDAETVDAAAEFDYTTDEQPVDDPSLLPEQPGKPHPPVSIPLSPSIFIMLALENAAGSVYPIYDENTLYMKFAQNFDTNPNMSSVFPSDARSYMNDELLDRFQ
jgi:hypothetical protein